MSLLASLVTLFPSKSHSPLFQNVFDFSKKELICDNPLVDILPSLFSLLLWLFSCCHKSAILPGWSTMPLVPLQSLVIYSCSSPSPPAWVVLELDPNSPSASSSSAYSRLPPPVSRPQGDPAVFSSNDLALMNIILHADSKWWLRTAQCSAGLVSCVWPKIKLTEFLLTKTSDYSWNE